MVQSVVEGSLLMQMGTYEDFTPGRCSGLGGSAEHTEGNLRVFGMYVRACTSSNIPRAQSRGIHMHSCEHSIGDDYLLGLTHRTLRERRKETSLGVDIAQREAWALFGVP